MQKTPTTTSKEQKIRYDNIKLQRQPASKTKADPNCNQLSIATATAIKPKMHLENTSDKVVFSRPR
jgi:hypothetical protein